MKTKRGSDEGNVPEHADRQFYQFVLAEFCEKFIHRDGPGGFWKLRDAQWYEASNLGIRFPIHKEMKKEANFSFGLWYRTHHFPRVRERYIDLVSELVNNQPDPQHAVSARDREAAFVFGTPHVANMERKGSSCGLRIPRCGEEIGKGSKSCSFESEILVYCVGLMSKRSCSACCTSAG
jgi:hypothetical protein